MLDKVFKKGASEEELQAKEDLMMKSSEEKYEEEMEKAGAPEGEKIPIPASSDRTVVKLEKDVELLKVQMELLKQNKQVHDEKFSKVAEQIGEIRATVLDSEKESATIKMQAEKSIELIQMVQPERLMNEVKKLELKIEEAKGVEEKFSAMQQKVVEELKDLRQKTEVIRGSETLLKLNEEVRHELSTAMQIQAKMEQRADKVEAMFSDFQQHFYEYQKVFDRMKELDAEFKDMMKEFGVFKVKIESAASKTDFVKLKNELREYGDSLDSKIIELDKSIAKAEMAKADILKDVEGELSDFKKELQQKVVSAEDAKRSLDSLRPELQKSIEVASSLLVKSLSPRISSLEDELSTLEKTRKELLALTSEVAEIGEMKSEYDKRLKAMEARNEETLQKVNKKIADYEDDVKDNTAVIRDLVKEIYQLKSHASNALSRSDLNAFQKGVNDKMIAFDMSLIKLEHERAETEGALRSLQRDLSLQQKEQQRELQGKLRELEEKVKRAQSGKSEGRDID